jgi:heptosyltransferase I
MIPAGNILILKPSSIGDVVHTLPIWNLLRRHYPQATISWLIAPACQGVVEGLPGLNLLSFDRKRWGQWWRNANAASDLRAFHRTLRDQQFDLVLDVQGLFRSGWFAWKTRAPVRVGFANAREMAWAFYTHRVPIDTPEQHAIERYRKLLEAIGCPSSPIEFPFPVTGADRARAEELIGEDRPFAVLCPGANWLTKRWPATRFAELVEPLHQRFGLETIVAGGPGDRELGEQITGSRNLCGQTTLMQLVALMERASLVITNDSGPMHIAAALRRPLVALFGPTNPVRTGPYGMPDAVVKVQLDCSPCYSRSCSHCRCMEQISVQSVLDRAIQQISKAG